MNERSENVALPTDERAPKKEKVIAFGCWSNNPQRINEPGQCGILKGRVFSSEHLAREYYCDGDNADKGDVIVRVVVEGVSDV